MNVVIHVHINYQVHPNSLVNRCHAILLVRFVSSLAVTEHHKAVPSFSINFIELKFLSHLAEETDKIQAIRTM